MNINHIRQICYVIFIPNLSTHNIQAICIVLKCSSTFLQSKPQRWLLQNRWSLSVCTFPCWVQITKSSPCDRDTDLIRTQWVTIILLFDFLLLSPPLTVSLDKSCVPLFVFVSSIQCDKHNTCHDFTTSCKFLWIQDTELFILPGSNGVGWQT